MKQLFLTTFLTFSFLFSEAQQSVGLFNYTEETAEGFTLFGPLRNIETYLINNCGEKVHSWTSKYTPGAVTYLLENGILLRTGNTQNKVFTAGGSGGIIEMIDWSGKIIWDYTISSNTECLHHDIEYLPNGNILAILWDLHDKQEATKAGKVNPGNSIWAEKIIEIEPDIENGKGTIVWEWNVWDHLIQDQSPTYDNFGIISKEPRLVNINYPLIEGPYNPDWLHINAIDYNENLDQIVLSIHTYNEIWIIDHSTTTEEAKGKKGGNSGHGGDLLFRYGNPQAYNKGAIADKLFFSQHHSHWIDEGLIDEGKLMVFNNSSGFKEGKNYSTVEILDPITDQNGNYQLVEGVFTIPSFDWTYKASNPEEFYSSFISGAQRLENGNTLITEGANGRFFEINESKNIVWEYVNPVGLELLQQGDSNVSNIVFRATKFPSSFAAFEGKNLKPKGYIEPGTIFTCQLYSDPINSTQQSQLISVYPNPASNYIRITSLKKIQKVTIYNSNGDLIQDLIFNNYGGFIDCSKFTNGIHFITTSFSEGAFKSDKVLIYH